MSEDNFLTPDLARAARALTKVSVGTIARHAGLSKMQVRDFEQGVAGLTPEEVTRLHGSLEHYGVRFIPEDAVAGYGVRRSHTRTGFMRLNTWEDEGGPAPQ